MVVLKSKGELNDPYRSQLLQDVFNSFRSLLELACTIMPGSVNPKFLFSKLTKWIPSAIFVQPAPKVARNWSHTSRDHKYECYHWSTTLNGYQGPKPKNPYVDLASTSTKRWIFKLVETLYAEPYCIQKIRLDIEYSSVLLHYRSNICMLFSRVPVALTNLVSNFSNCKHCTLLYSFLWHPTHWTQFIYQ